MADIKLKILQIYKVFYPDVYGGIPYIIDAIRKIGGVKVEHEVLVCSSNSGNLMDGVSRIRSFGEFLSLPIAPMYPFALVEKLRGADIAILHSPFPFGDLVFGLGFGLKTKLFVFWHSEIVRQKWLLPIIRPFILKTLKRAERILVSHQGVIDSSPMLAAFKNKVSIIPFFIDTALYLKNPDRERKIAKIRARYGERLVVSCGRLVSYKGFDVLLSAVRSLDACVLIIGEGPEHKRLQNQIESLSLSDRVFLLGSVSQEDLIAYLHSADVFVLPSVSAAETFGIVQLEAMACSRPIVNTRLPTAVCDVARDGMEAVTVAPGSVDELTAAIDKLLNNPEFSRALGEQGLKRVKQEFASETFKSNIESFLSTAAGAA